MKYFHNTATLPLSDWLVSQEELRQVSRYKQPNRIKPGLAILADAARWRSMAAGPLEGVSAELFQDYLRCRAPQRSEPFELKFHIWNMKCPRVSGHFLRQLRNFGGVDRTRTRDPRRERPILQVNSSAGLRAIQIPKVRETHLAFAERDVVEFQILLRGQVTRSCNSTAEHKETWQRKSERIPNPEDARRGTMMAVPRREYAY